MLHRVFTAINLPDNIKERVLAIKKDYPTLPARWTKKENLHLTLNFLGNVDDGQLTEVLAVFEQEVSKHQPFVLKIKNVSYGPPKKFPPRMVWLKIEKSQEVSDLQAGLEQSFFSLPSFKFKIRQGRGYQPHITLARIKTFKFRQLLEPPEIDIGLDLSFEVNSVDLMESQLKKEGAEYTILKSIHL